MSEKKQEAEASSPRAKVWSALISTTVGAIGSLISALVSSAELFRAPWAIGAAVAAVVISTIFTLLLARRERGPSRLANLKNELARAYLGALDGSALNPDARESR